MNEYSKEEIDKIESDKQNQRKSYLQKYFVENKTTFAENLRENKNCRRDKVNKNQREYRNKHKDGINESRRTRWHENKEENQQKQRVYKTATCKVK